MQKSILIPLAIVSVFIFSFYKIESKQPKIIFSTLTVEYGKVEYNSYPYRTITIRNVGDAPLTLLNVKISGGGLSPGSYTKAPILPNEMGKISFKYDTRRLGKFNKSITVVSNSNLQVIRVKGFVMDTIQPQIQADTNIVDYGTITQNSNPYRIFKFKNIGKKELIIKRVKCSGTCVATRPKVPIPPNGTGEIKIKYDTNRLGKINRSVRLETNDEHNPYYIVRLKGLIELTKEEKIKRGKKSILDQ